MARWQRSLTRISSKGFSWSRSLRARSSRVWVRSTRRSSVRRSMGTSSLVEWILLSYGTQGGPVKTGNACGRFRRRFHWYIGKEAEDTSKRTPVFSPSSYQSSGQKATDRAGALSPIRQFRKSEGMGKKRAVGPGPFVGNASPWGSKKWLTQGRICSNIYERLNGRSLR